MNLAAIGGLRGVPDTAVWFRAVDPRHIATALATGHTPRILSRFSPGPASAVPFPALYLAENPVVALFEVQALFGSPSAPGSIVPHPKRAFVTLNIQVRLSNVLDLVDPANQAALGTTAQELTGDWLGYSLRSGLTSAAGPTGPAPTQELGEAAASAGFEGVRTFSARLPYHQTLVVFPANLASASRVTSHYRDASGVPVPLTVS